MPIVFEQIKNPKEFLEAVEHHIRGQIKKCGRCGLCSACGVAIYLGWVTDPLSPSEVKK